MSEQEDEMEILDFTTGDSGDSGPWKISAGQLKNLRGMIIDRDKAWRANAEMAPVINHAILQGIRNIDRDTFDRIYQFLGHGGLPGTYETSGFDERQMREAWRQYLPRYYRVKAKPKIAAELGSEAPV
jgi:hypothetical protein